MDSLKAAIFMQVLCVFLCFNSSNGYRFHVGGKDGWVIRPSEDYSHWSYRNRFLVNDTLYFRYSKGEDSVLEVSKDQYYNCNSSNPLLKMDDGSSEFKLRRSGPFFFISGVKDKCEKGQRLLVVVLSEHHHYRRSPAPSPSVYPPSISPSPAPSSGHHQSAPASPPSKFSPAPTMPPASSPAKISPAPAVSPAASSPAKSPASSPPKSSSAPTRSPASPPSKVSPAPAVSPATSSQAIAPAASPKPSPATPTPVSGAPASSPERADDGNSPAPSPSKNAASKILMALPVTIALIACSIGAF